MALWSITSLQDAGTLSNLDRAMCFSRDKRWRFLAYPEWVLRMPFNFACSICGFFLLFWVYWFLQYPDKGVWWTFGQSMTVVISRNNVDSMAPEQEVVVTLAKQVGILHLAFLAGSFMTFMQRK